MAESEHAASPPEITRAHQIKPNPEVSTQKAILRKEILAARSRLTVRERKAAGQGLRDAVLDMPQAAMAGTIAAYVSIGTEPDTVGLIFALWKRGSYLLLPVLCEDNDLNWASYEGPDSLAPGPRGLLQPTEPVRGVTAIASADLVIVPALAVGADGHRLGRGAGCYDRALARVAPAVPTLALLHENELLEAVPSEPHDQRVRAVAQPMRGITRLA
jgi:5-formyltetrahydrofolate cyclo-ligase